MFNKSEKKINASNPEIERRLSQVESTLSKLSTDITKILKNEKSQTVYIDIDNLSIDKLDLEQLAFDIEGINVKELGGSLSIGINVDGKKMKISPSIEHGKEMKKETKIKKPPIPPHNKAKEVNVNFTYKS